MRMLVVDNHPLIRKGISVVISGEMNIEIHEAGNIDEAIAKFEKQHFHIVLIDLKLGREQGMDVIRYVSKMKLNTKVAILSSYISQAEFDVSEKLGVVYGYLLKNDSIEDIVYAIKTIGSGRKYYSPDVIKAVAEEVGNNPEDKLTKREREVFKQLQYGYSNMDIAQKLFLSEFTVKKHVSSILSKLNLSSRAQVACYFNNVNVS